MDLIYATDLYPDLAEASTAVALFGFGLVLGMFIGWGWARPPKHHRR